jgi:hypothetical protein
MINSVYLLKLLCLIFAAYTKDNAKMLETLIDKISEKCTSLTKCIKRKLKRVDPEKVKMGWERMKKHIKDYKELKR